MAMRLTVEGVALGGLSWCLIPSRGHLGLVVLVPDVEEQIGLLIENCVLAHLSHLNEREGRYIQYYIVYCIFS